MRQKRALSKEEQVTALKLQDTFVTLSGWQGCTRQGKAVYGEQGKHSPRVQWVKKEWPR